MPPIFYDPSRRRVWLLRLSVAVVILLLVAVLAVFSHDLQPSFRPALTLKIPRRAAARRARRSPRGQRPGAGPAAASARGKSKEDATTPAGENLEVIAFLEPRVRGALESLERHAPQIGIVAQTGLLLGDGGRVQDGLDSQALDVVHRLRLPVWAVIQNLDQRHEGWREDRVHQLGREPSARQRLAASLERLCLEHRLAGVNLDLEELSKRDWSSVIATAAEVTRRLRPHGLVVSIDVPTQLDPKILKRLSEVTDRVVVMAYDESDDDGPPGPIASESWFEKSVAAARAAIAADRLIIGVGAYAYDWHPNDAADPLSFVDAMATAKEARAQVLWDPAVRNPHFSYSDELGVHEVWMLDAATLWNQRQIVEQHGVAAVALWRLGGEDPGTWEALARQQEAAAARGRLGAVSPDGRVDNLGDGPFLALSLAPESGIRELSWHGARVAEERWQRLPSPFVIRRAGIVPGKAALTFDDGPDPVFTPRVLDVLKERRVPASFFVVGANVERWPELVQRAFDEGHIIGNHSFTHPNVEEVGDGRLGMELEGTSRLLESVIGRRPRLYRPPSLADIEPRTAVAAGAFARAGALGYLIVDADVDPQDFRRPTLEEVAAHTLAEVHEGGVILLHDGGGDRHATVAALPRIIDGLRARGIEMVSLAELIGKSPEEIMALPAPRPQLAAAADHAVFSGTTLVLTVLASCFNLALGLIALRSVAVLLLALWAERRRCRQRRSIRSRAAITAVIPVYNEAAVIEKTLAALLASDVPIRVIVVDDGSSDGTGEVVKRRFGNERRVVLISQRNQGKAMALERGFAAADGPIVVALDGDTLFYPDTVRRLVEPFADPRVAAVAGTAEVGNVATGISCMQAVEYMVQQQVERRAWHVLGALPVVPGAVGAWRREAVRRVGGFRSDTVAEDADLAMALGRAGYRLAYAPLARARTEAPETLVDLVKQRRRWSFGVYQAMWKHRRALVERRSGALGRLVLPALIVSQLLLPLLTPFAFAAAVVALWAHNLGPALEVSLLLLAAELLHAAVAARWAGSGGRLIPWVIVGRMCYRPLLFLTRCARWCRPSRA